MKNNYPIKYAVIPMLEETKTHNPEIVYYISAKCFVIEEKKRFFKDGKEKTTYDVVMPYTQSDFYRYERQEPSYNLISNKCINSCNVDELFDSYEDANKAKDKKNNELYVQKVALASLYQEDLEFLNIDFEAKQRYYDMLQESILMNTDDLIVGIKNKPQIVIIIDKGDARCVESSLYETIEAFKYYHYIVRTLNQRDFIIANNEVKSERKIPKNLGDLLLVNDPQSRIVKVCDNDDFIYLKDGKITDELEEKTSFNDKANIIFYTLEDFYDITKSYPSKESTFELKRIK